nr:ATP-binding protein [Anaerobacillus alkaliphilus]
MIIDIEDNGIGMSNEQLNNLGTPFHTTKPDGTGLGMMVTNNIIKNNHKGTIYIDSQQNHGTTFKIYLPIKPDIEF